MAGELTSDTCTFRSKHGFLKAKPPEEEGEEGVLPTNTGSGTEWKVGPTCRVKRSPTFRLEFVCVRSVNVLSSVESIGVNFNDGTLGNENLGFSIWAAATRNERVLIGETTRPW